MSLEDPVVITCSISGAVANRDQCPAIPYTPEEYAAEARRIVDEGPIPAVHGVVRWRASVAGSGQTTVRLSVSGGGRSGCPHRTVRPN